MAAPRKEDVRSTILDATEILLTNHSIDKLSLANIASAAGISKGTLYYHYKTKEAILLDLTDRFLEHQKEELFAWTEDPSKDTSLHRMVKYVIERDVYETGPRIHLIYNACIGNEEVRDMVVARYRVFEAIIAEKIAPRVKNIDPDFLARMLLMLSDGLVLQNEMGAQVFDIDQFIQQSAELMTRYEVKK